MSNIALQTDHSGGHEPAMVLGSNLFIPPLLASSVAGPLCLLFLLLLSLAEQVFSSAIPPSFRDIEKVAAETANLLYPALMLGLIFSIVPNAVGTAVLGVLGKNLAGARLTSVWIMTGAIVGAAFAIGVAPADARLIAFFATIGGTCAAICRGFTRWRPNAGAL